MAARARERGSVLVVVASRFGWPVAPDLALAVDGVEWKGLARGHGHLRARRVTVAGVGRRAAARRRGVDLWLPASTGEVATVEIETVEVEPAPVEAGPVERHLRAV
jgi:hypothetical protein